MKKLFRPEFAFLWTLLTGAGFGYAANSFRYEFLSWSNLPLVGFYAALAGVCFAALFTALFALYHEKKRWIAFPAALLVFEGILWTTLTLLNRDGQHNRTALAAAGAILLPLFGLLCFLLLWTAAKRKWAIVHRSLAFLTCLGFCIAGAASFLPSPEDLYFMTRFEENPSFTDFTPLTADETAILPAQQARVPAFTPETLRDPALFPFAFRLDGAALDCGSMTDGWDFSMGEVAPVRGGEAATATWTHAETGLQVRLEAARYPANATYCWTAYLTNGGTRGTPEITDLQGIRTAFPLASPAYYAARGSHDAAHDFALLRVKHPEKAQTFAGVGGRPTDAYMPYFNLCGADAGAVIGLGWTGQWAATLQDRDGTTVFSAGQESFAAPLEPGETVRTPLVSVSFYEGGNPVKGFNTFRRWILDAVYPENTPTVLNSLDVLFVSHTRTQAEIFADLDTYRPEVLAQVDDFWMDAGWYAGCKESWSDGNGSWRTDDARFPGGIRAVADRAKQTGSGLLVWFEPERLVHGSPLWQTGQEHPQWIVDLAPGDADNGTVMWNLAEPEAAAYLADYIGGFIRDNGITVYRQDFNFEPLKFWEYADAHYYGGRTGIAENLYVQGLYDYLDRLFAMNPGLLMDNCSSGGRRLDLEMARRSIPLWRSDYNCSVHPDSLEATQSHTYNLSLWLPLSGVNIYLQNGYAAVSSIYPGNLFTIDSGDSRWFGKFDDLRAGMVKDVFPAVCAGTKADGFTAMQYGDADEGFALVFRHKDAKELTLRLSGLDPAADYRVEDATYTETDETQASAPETLTGADLMRDGRTYGWADGQPAAAVVLRYTRLR